MKNSPMKYAALVAAFACGTLFSACGAKDAEPERIVEPPADCEKLDQADCESHAHCGVQQGRPANEQEACMEDRAFAACFTRDVTRVCTDAETWAKAPDGQFWLLLNGCVPTGWEAAAPSTSVFEPTCPE